MRRHSLVATTVLVAMAIGPIALAQTTTKPKKKGTKPAASASASASATATADATPTATADTTTPAASDSASAAPAKALPETPPPDRWDNTDTREDPSKNYYFVGLRYRGDVIPKFMENLFVDDGATVYSNAVGVEFDSRKDGFSKVFALTFQNYSMGDTLFHQKTKPLTDGFYSDVKSTLNALYASVDLLWAVPLDTMSHWNFEYGVGLGLGVVFGDIYDDWVYSSPNGPLVDPSTGQHYAACQTTSQGPAGTSGCIPSNHQNPSPAKVGGYTEPAGIAGPKPILFPMINFPQLGLRYKPVKNFEARLGLGFSLTGFWFGISGDYGLEKQPEGSTEPAKKDAGSPTVHGML